MITMRKICIVLVFAVVAATVTHAGPFGLDMGMSLQQIEELTGKTPIAVGADYMVTPPKPHPVFEKYVVSVSPTVGLYVIIALGNDIESSSFGTQLKDAFENVRTQLQGIYGEPKVYDFLEYKSIWNETNEWMMALSRKERHLTAFWKREYGSVLPDSIDGIMLDAKASNSSKGYLVLRYEFSNFQEGAAEKKEKQSSVF